MKKKDLIIGETYIYNFDNTVTLIAFNDKEFVLHNDHNGYFIRQLDYLEYLKPIPKVHHVDFWLNVYPNCHDTIHGTREAADIYGGKGRIACINIKRDVTEGEGL